MEHTKLFLLKEEIFHLSKDWLDRNEKHFLESINNLNSFNNLKLQYESKNFKAFFELVFLTCFNGGHENEMKKWKKTIIKGIKMLKHLDLLSSPYIISTYKYLIEVYCRKYNLNYVCHISIDNRDLTHGLKSEIEMYKSILNNYNIKNLNCIYINSILGKETPLINLNSNQLYSITHILFYISLLNNIELSEVLSDKEVKYSIDVVKSMIVFSGKINHFDLLGEMLICLTLLKGKRLNNAELDLMVFYLEILLKKFIRPTVKIEESKSNFDRYYHQMLVMNMLGRVLE